MEVMSAKLFVRKVKITPSLVLSNERMPGRLPAKYPITRAECNVIHLPQGQRSFTHDNLFLGHLSKRIVFGIVDNCAYNGDMTMSPFNILHCNSNFLAVHLDGQQIPWAPLHHHFLKITTYGPFTRNSQTGKAFPLITAISSDGSICLRDTLFTVLRLTPDLSSSCGHHLNVTKTGNLQFELEFERSMPFTGNVIVYSKFDNIIEIDKDCVGTRNYGY